MNPFMNKVYIGGLVVMSVELRTSYNPLGVEKIDIRFAAWTRTKRTNWVAPNSML